MDAGLGRLQVTLQLIKALSDAVQGHLKLPGIVVGGLRRRRLRGHIPNLHFEHGISQPGLESVQIVANGSGGGLPFLPQAPQGIGAGAIKGGEHVFRASFAHPVDNGQPHRKHILHQGEAEGVKRIGCHQHGPEVLSAVWRDPGEEGKDSGSGHLRGWWRRG